jgi:molybdopterin/thiamine biosynthesis adenylyltransferase
MNDIVFPAEALAGLRKDLLGHSPNEAAAVLLAGPALQGDRTRLLIREVFPAPPQSCDEQGPYRVSVSAAFIAPLLKRARNEGWSLVMAHTHPFSEGTVGFSTVDDDGEAALFPTIFGRAAGRPHASVVLGLNHATARLWKSALGPPETADRIVQTGRSWRASRPGGEEKQAGADEYDRSVRAFGREGQAAIGSMRFGIVGLGGTGSFVAQELAHLGATNLVLLDFDRVERSNLNRLIGASGDAVGKPKVEVAAQNVRSIRRDIAAEAIVGDVLRAADAARLLGCDLIFCCTDSHGSRAVLNQLSYQYMIPVIDMGVRIQVVDGRVADIAGRVQMLGPGLPCLVCNGFLDPEQVRRDLLTDEARARDPYIVGASEPQPAVVSLNGTVASMAVTMMLATVTGMPSSARHQVLIGMRGMVRAIDSVAEPGCVICSLRGTLGRGDTRPMPGRPE